MKIEKNIEMPTVAEGGGRPAKYPFGEMVVGDSVFFENEPKGSQTRRVWAAHAFGRNHGKKFATRSIDGGVRIWRVA